MSMYTEFDLQKIEEQLVAHRNTAKMLQGQGTEVAVQLGYERELKRFEDAGIVAPQISYLNTKTEGRDKLINGLRWYAQHKDSRATGEIWVYVSYRNKESDLSGGIYTRKWHTETEQFMNYSESIKSRTQVTLKFHPDTGREASYVHALSDYKLAVLPFDKVVAPSLQRVRGYFKRSGYILEGTESWRYRSSEKVAKIRVSSGTNIIHVRLAYGEKKAPAFWGELRAKMEQEGFKSNYAQNDNNEFLGLDVYHWEKP